MAHHKIFDNDLFWLVPVDVRGTQTVDLSNSNTSAPPLALILNEDRAPKAVTAPPSPPAPPEKPHQPKWLVEELAREKKGVQERRETKGSWRLVQTVFKRNVSQEEKLEDTLNDVLKNSEQFQSQAVIASSLSRDECRQVASQTAKRGPDVAR